MTGTNAHHHDFASALLSEDEYGRYSVIDGKQRITAIHRFLLHIALGESRCSVWW